MVAPTPWLSFFKTFTLLPLFNLKSGGLWVGLAVFWRVQWSCKEVWHRWEMGVWFCQLRSCGGSAAYVIVLGATYLLHTWGYTLPGVISVMFLFSFWWPVCHLQDVTACKWNQRSLGFDAIMDPTLNGQSRQSIASRQLNVLTFTLY